ncbi:ABC transporter permease [Desulfobacula sp.]|uniref:ABC transporter permease n=1 Tax=Desulfobacula sp. TaxID=2593537 RepID=UPI0026105B86|nr:ABC transporter permease [Desulfobacula sp.]
MKAYIIRRLFQAIAVCLAISMISFFLLFLNSDPALLLLPPEAEIEDIEIFKKSMGLDRPVLIQYLSFLKKVLLHGDFGNSFVSKIPALDLVIERIPATLKLSLLAVLLANALAIPMGMISAVKRYTLADNLITFLALVGQAMPLYWFGIMLIIIFGVFLGWLPISGSDSFVHMIMPSITLGAWLLPVNMRLVRSGMLDVLNQDYIRTARAKGLFEKTVMIKHAFKNAMIPMVTVTGMQLSLLLGGAVVTETVFAWPGLGRLAVESIRMGDYPVVQAIVVFFALCVVIGNLLADILTAFIDPRIRLE